MIPLLSITNLVNAIISAAIAGRLWQSYARKPSAALGYFVAFYTTFALFWLWWSAPELFTTDPVAVLITNTLGYITLFIAMGFMARLPTLFWDHTSRWVTILSIFLFVGVVAVIVGRLLDLTLPMREAVNGYAYWPPTLPKWCRVLTGVAAVVTTCTAVGTFLRFGLRDQHNPLVHRRALLIASGLLFLLGASIVSFFASASGQFWANAVGSLIVIAGSLLVLYGVVDRTGAAAETTSTITIG